MLPKQYGLASKSQENPMRGKKKWVVKKPRREMVDCVDEEYEEDRWIWKHNGVVLVVLEPEPDAFAESSPPHPPKHHEFWTRDRLVGLMLVLLELILLCLWMMMMLLRRFTLK